MKRLLKYIQKQKKVIEEILLKEATYNFADMYYVADVLRHNLPQAPELSNLFNEVLAPIKYWNQIHQVLEKIEQEIKGRVDGP